MATAISKQWDQEVDVLVVGSGNGGLTAALCNHEMGCKDVLVIEKSNLYGGTSSLSGGGVWIPGNHYAQAAGAVDSYEDALSYLKATTPEGAVPVEMQESFLRNGPKMIRFLHDRTQVRYVTLAEYPDYFSDAPGARTGHRSMEPAPVNISELKDDGARLRPSHQMLYMLGQIPITQKEAYVLVAQLPGWIKLAGSLVWNYVSDWRQRLKTWRSRRATCGSAGVARLMLSLEERNIPVWLNTDMQNLVIEDGRVVGVEVERDGRPLRIGARKAVILASGGFEHNALMREQYLPKPTSTEWSAAHRGNTGRPLQSAIEKGAATRAMDGSWWCTTLRVPGEAYPRLSIMEKSYPGSCVVNRHGKRVANESMNYLMFVQNCFEAQKQGVPVDELWMVFDARFRASYIVGPLMTSKLYPDIFLPGHYFCPQFLTKADSIEALAEQTGINKAGLRNTIQAMNEYARTGVDAEFNRGGYAYDRYYGDPRVSPNPCLASISEGPYYAVRLYLGEFGTHGGLVTNPDAQVVRSDGEVFNGLYAIGNCSAPVLPTYPGPGSTLGPAMTFAYQAAKHINGFED